MYSLNVPVPSDVARLAGDLAGELPGATERPRGEHTLVVKRLGTGGAESYHRIEAQVRELLRGQPPFAARVEEVAVFEDPETGPGPVVYLAVESRELRALHGRLCERFDPVTGIEGDAYVPHVTVARGGSLENARRVTERDVEPIEWSVEDLVFLDADRGTEAGRLSLPA